MFLMMSSWRSKKFRKFNTVTYSLRALKVGKFFGFPLVVQKKFTTKNVRPEILIIIQKNYKDRKKRFFLSRFTLNCASVFLKSKGIFLQKKIGKCHFRSCRESCIEFEKCNGFIAKKYYKFTNNLLFEIFIIEINWIINNFHWHV